MAKKSLGHGILRPHQFQAVYARFSLERQDGLRDEIGAQWELRRHIERWLNSERFMNYSERRMNWQYKFNGNNA